MIEIVIFDLGRVLIEVDVNRCLAQFSEAFNVTVQEVIGDKNNGAHTDFMVGKITGEEFHQLTCERFGRHIDIEAFRNVWLSMLGQPKRGTIAVVAELLKGKVPVALLSNVDPWHFSQCEKIIPEIQKIKKRYLSYQIKIKKPDLQIYRYVVDDLKIPAEKCLFVDDLLENVEAAKEVGIKTIHFEDSQQLVTELERYDILV